MSDEKRILVRGPNWIGDHVMALGFYRGLRAAHPNARVTLAAPAQLAGLNLRGCFDEVIALSSEERRFPFGAWRAGRALAARKFDLGITLPATLSGALLLFAAGIPRRVGFKGDGSGIFLTESRAWRGREAKAHKADQYRALLDLVTGASAPEVEPAPLAASSAKRIVLAPGASIALREWPYFRELVERLRREYPDHSLSIVGGMGDAKWRALASIDGVEDLVGRTTLDEVVALCRDSRLVIANDSGIAHVAATLAGATTLVLFGPGDPDYIAPRGARVIQARVRGLACSPCEKPYCKAPYGYQRCLRDLDVDTVWRLARQALSL